MDDETIQACREWLVRRKAQLDQRKKQYEDQYPMVHPDLNKKRLDDLDVSKFIIEIHEWELDQIIDSQEEDDEARDH